MKRAFLCPIKISARRKPMPAFAHLTTETRTRRGAKQQRRRCATPFQRSEEHTSELQSLMRISYAVFCLKKKKQSKKITPHTHTIHNTHIIIHQQLNTTHT